MIEYLVVNLKFENLYILKLNIIGSNLKTKNKCLEDNFIRN